ncbi:AI-2E family transporter [Pandoraea pneumonica]|jgi:AI-2 transport protein TqsA|uniref:AI-2E family transporter n=1 Tax=Pandoraea pneumonica TaxID=2508299 RepID=A0A5E4SJX7_9BURK|nr:AI-2E family transporter [Pandoraea pneumonica]VVD75625.1 AI-2E family transporter [Pandoraea pneumonica]
MTSTPGSVGQTTTGVAAGLAILYFLRPVLIPFFLAVLLRILISGIVSVVVRLLPRAPKWLILLATVVIVGFSAYSIFIVTLQGISDLIKQSPDLPGQLDRLIRTATVGFGRRFDLATVLALIDLPHFEHTIAAWLGDAVSMAFLTLMFLVFMLLGSMRNADPKILRITTSEARANSQRLVLNKIVHGVQAYLISQTAINLAIAVISALVFRVAELPNTAFWAVTVFLLAFMPVVGPFVASVVPALFAALHSDSISVPLAVFLVTLAIFQIAHNIVQPKLQARSTNTDPLVGIFALGIWTLIWGVPGAILSTPLTVLVMVIAAQFQSSRWLAILISHDGDPDSALAQPTTEK